MRILKSAQQMILRLPLSHNTNIFCRVNLMEQDSSRTENDKNSFKSENRIEGLSCCMCLQQANCLLLCFSDMKEAYACLKASKNDAMIFFLLPSEV